jgi:hypothetical protein
MTNHEGRDFIPTIPTSYFFEKADLLNRAIRRLKAHESYPERDLNDIIDMATRLITEAEKWLQVIKERK